MNIATRKEELASLLQKNKNLLATLPVERQREFEKNFLSLVTQDYLISSCPGQELIEFCLAITKQGLSIDPAYKEVYIVPFETRVRGQKVMLPQAIIPLKGMQEKAFQQGFFLRLYEVYDFGDGDIVSEAEMTRKHQVMLETTNPAWVDRHFVGFDVVLQDLRGEIPQQTKFVERGYLQGVTKTLRNPMFKIQTYRHKAVRRAFGDFFIPRARRIEVFEQIEYLNDNMLATSDEDVTANTPKFSELKKALEPVGVALSIEGDIATASGNVYKNAKLLKSLGFELHNGKWICHCENDGEESSLNSLTDLKRLGIEIVKKTIGDKDYEIVVGNTDGLEETLTQLGFVRGKTSWGRELKAS